MRKFEKRAIVVFFYFLCIKKDSFSSLTILLYSHLPTSVNQCVPVQKFTKVDSLLTWTLLKWELQRWKGGENLLKWSSCCSATERCRLSRAGAAAWPGLSMSQLLNPNFWVQAVGCEWWVTGECHLARHIHYFRCITSSCRISSRNSKKAPGCFFRNTWQGLPGCIRRYHDDDAWVQRHTKISANIWNLGTPDIIVETMIS